MICIDNVHNGGCTLHCTLYSTDLPTRAAAFSPREFIAVSYCRSSLCLAAAAASADVTDDEDDTEPSGPPSAAAGESTDGASDIIHFEADDASEVQQLPNCLYNFKTGTLLRKFG